MHPPFSAWPLQGQSGPRVPGQAGNFPFSMAVSQRASQALGSQTKKPGSPLPQLIMSWPGPVKPWPRKLYHLTWLALPRSCCARPRRLHTLFLLWSPQIWPEPGLPGSEAAKTLPQLASPGLARYWSASMGQLHPHFLGWPP